LGDRCVDGLWFQHLEGRCDVEGGDGVVRLLREVELEQAEHEVCASGHSDGELNV
jgi:hypothetical protein